MADPVLADARAYLTRLPNVTILDGYDPREPDCLAVVFCGIRYYEVRMVGDGVLAAHHLRDGEWLPLTVDATPNGAFAAIAAHVERMGHLPAWYSAETEAAVRGAAAEVLAGVPAALWLAA
jgi:hypothetical protein